MNGPGTIQWVIVGKKKMGIIRLTNKLSFLRTLFIIPTDAHNYKIIGMLKTIKIPTTAPICFGSSRNHQRAVHGTGRNWIQFLPVPCTTRLHNRLVRRHDIDHVINDKHNRIIIVVLAKHEITPWWWFLSEPKHVGAIVGILIVFNIPMIL